MAEDSDFDLSMAWAFTLLAFTFLAPIMWWVIRGCGQPVHWWYYPCLAGVLFALSVIAQQLAHP